MCLCILFVGDLGSIERPSFLSYAFALALMLDNFSKPAVLSTSVKQESD